MNIRQAYNQWSGSYDTDLNRTRDLDRRVTAESLNGIKARSIVEIGCGTGKNTTFLAGLGQKVLALDFARGMIRQAQSKVTATNVSFALADLTRPWPCRAGVVDLLVCNLVLEHVDNLQPVFKEAGRVLAEGSHFFICELHPFRQYQGVQANFQSGEQAVEIPAFVHHISDFLAAAEAHGLRLHQLEEWWDEEAGERPPRLVSFLFTKAPASPTP